MDALRIERLVWSAALGLRATLDSVGVGKPLGNLVLACGLVVANRVTKRTFLGRRNAGGRPP
ncbi:hypothetical protein C474_12156 [Halogeometricum pallidum JCM 14848]|uniref:Uncharacterized protein n=1 Tax=Halogeometricum pallidum JCM 14848 TaxID=1227487 RepID=M0D2N7_HALPD|nr:hypothetical protein [Halogeometricum pallidum]ELZ29786.1 hypothetical protein C474_12156 [Halogeometricum pallidum JCM 14848]